MYRACLFHQHMFPLDVRERRPDICRRPYKYHYAMLATEFAVSNVLDTFATSWRRIRACLPRFSEYRDPCKVPTLVLLQLYGFVNSFGYSLRIRHATSNATAEISDLATQREVDGVRPSRRSRIGNATRHWAMAIRVREEHTLLTVEEPHLLS